MKKKLKKEKSVKAVSEVVAEVTASELVLAQSEAPKIAKLELDFTSDGLNKMAAKINEIIECLP